MYVYIKSEPGLWTVGFYRQDGTGIWEPESDHTTAEAAAERIAWLNGSPIPPPEQEGFLLMLDRAGIGHGTQEDGLSVQVEHEDGKTTTDWHFDRNGLLVSTLVYEE